MGNGNGSAWPRDEVFTDKLMKSRNAFRTCLRKILTYEAANPDRLPRIYLRQSERPENWLAAIAGPHANADMARYST